MDLRARLKQAGEGTDKAKDKKDKPKRNLNPFKYIKESVLELRKVNWPKRPEVVRGTITVLIISAVFVIILGGSDWVFQRALNQILGGDANSSTLPSTVETTTGEQIDPLNLPGNIPPPPGLEEGDNIDLENSAIPLESTGTETVPPTETESGTAP